MLFRGTATYPNSHSLSTALEDLGGTLNASTATDHGTLSISVPAESLEKTLAILAEVVQAPLLTDIEVERRIIGEEMLEDFDERGRYVDAVGIGRELAFRGHPLGSRITGTPETLESFDETHLRRHHARTYVGAGMTLALAGPLDPDVSGRWIEHFFSDLPKGLHLNASSPPPAAPCQARWLKHSGSSQTRIYLGQRTTGHRDPKDASLEMLLRVLDDGMSTRLYHSLCDSSGLCYDVSGSYEPFEDAGIVEFVADTAHDRTAEVVRTLLSILDDLAQHGPTERELARALQRARWQSEAVLEDAYATAEEVAFTALSGRDPAPEEQLARLLSVRREDLRDTAQAFFGEHGRTLVLVGLPPSSTIDELVRLGLPIETKSRG